MGWEGLQNGEPKKSLHSEQGAGMFSAKHYYILIVSLNYLLLLFRNKRQKLIIYTCQLFSLNPWDFLSPQNLNFQRFIDGFRRLPRISEDSWRPPNIFDDFQRLPNISQQLPKITKGVERFSMTSKEGQQFPKDLQPISSIIIKGVQRMFWHLLKHQKKEISFKSF